MADFSQDFCIDRALSALRAYYAAWWAQVWDEIRPGQIGILGPSFYLICTEQGRFAIDPCFRFPWVEELVSHRMMRDFASLDCIVLTHSHADHWEPALLRQLKDLPLRWILPKRFTPEMLDAAQLPQSRIEALWPKEQITLCGVTLEAFRSPHETPLGIGGVPELGYLMTYGGKRILFPCDVRDYYPAKLPDFGTVDSMIAHVWLGSGHALELPCEPYRTQAAAFIDHFHPKQVFLGHLYELARTPDQMWTYAHAGLLADTLTALDPERTVTPFRIGRCHDLLKSTARTPNRCAGCLYGR